MSLTAGAAMAVRLTALKMYPVVWHCPPLSITFVIPAGSRAAASPPATGDREGGFGAVRGVRPAAQDAQTPAATEEQDAQWVFDLKLCCPLTVTSRGTASRVRRAVVCASCDCIRA